jgi:hypothetical protein
VINSQLDLVTTPAGDLVAMVHCNNGASELNAWAGLFAEFAEALGVQVDTLTVFDAVHLGEQQCPDGGGLMAYNYQSGEPITELPEGRPLFLRSPDKRLRPGHVHAYTAVLVPGHPPDRHGVLQKDEGVRLDRMFAHSDLFKTQGVAQRFLATVDTPVLDGDVAAEGGAWGIAVFPPISSTAHPSKTSPTT